MPHRLLLIFVLVSGTAPPLFAESRPWKSADGLHTVQAEFVNRDETRITIRDESGKQFTMEISKLDAEDAKWLNLNHPLAGPPPGPAAFFDTLTFTDTRESTLAKLKVSKIVMMTTDETFLGRSGMNGVFRTRQKIGKLNGLLFFDWSEAGKLKEFTLQTETIPAAAYVSDLEPSWKEFVDLLTMLYGKPVSKGPMPTMGNLGDSSFAPSHLWNLDGGGSALLGTAREGNKYQLVVRFTQKKVGLVELP